MSRAASLVLVSALTLACSDSEQKAAAPEIQKKAAVAVPAAEAATIAGTVKLNGPVPAPEPINLGSDCHHGDSATKPRDESVVAGAAGELANVFVYVKNFDGRMAAPVQPILLDQKGCIYRPRVAGVQAGQIIQIRNSDATFHNVHAVAKSNEEFNFSQPSQGAVDIRKFDNPEVMVKLKCDVHPWMKSYVGVVDHSYFAVTDAAGRFSISGLPAGKWELEAWHEKYGTQSQTITVAAKQAAQASFTFAAK